jgi:hypothetical protein
MKALRERIEELGKTCHVVLLGNINIAATDEDMYNPGHKEHKVLCLCTPEERQFYTDMLALGFKDAYRVMHPGQKYYSWWKCFKKLWAMSRGYRLDYVFLPETVQQNHLIRSVILASYRYHSASSDHAPVLVTYYQQPLKKAISNFITNHDIESFNKCQCTECNEILPYKNVQHNKYSTSNGFLQACANLGMIINEFEVGNSISSQEKAMEEGRNLLEEFKTSSPEKVKNGTTEEEIIDLRKSFTFFYNHNEHWINHDIEVGHWSRIAAKNAFHPDHQSLVINYPIITDDNQHLVSNPLEIMKS